MKRAMLLLSMCLMPGCTKNIEQLETLKSGLQRELAEKTAIAANLTERRRELDALRQQVKDQLAAAGIERGELHVAPPTLPEAVAVPLPPPPPESIWEGSRGARLRAEIARMEAEVGQLDKIIAVTRDIDRQRAEANATLKAIADLKRAHGTSQANEAQ